MFKNRQEEESLIAAIRNGSQDAFEILYEKYAAVLLGHAMQISMDIGLAELTLKNTFLNVWKGIGNESLMKGQFNLFVCLIQTIRKESKSLITEMAESHQTVNQGQYNFVSSNRTVDFNEEHSFDKQERAVLNCYFRGYSADQTAAFLNISLPEVKYKLRTVFKTKGKITA
jgi:DNA-directed RNA polymerase specialized sigma24 family protein